MKKMLCSAMAMLILCLCGLSLMAADKKIISIEQAQENAKGTNRDILVDFGGSDWCGWCIKLDKEVFSTDTWKKEGNKKYVLVILDFPRQKEQSKAQKEYNKNIQQTYGVNGFPTVFLLDSNGKPYARTGYQEGGPEKYLNHLNELAAQKNERDSELKKIKEAKATDEKLPLLDNLINKLNQWRVGFAYLELKDETIKLDNENKSGLKLKYATELFQDYQVRQNKEKADSYLQIIKQLDPAKAKDLEIGMQINAILDKYQVSKDWSGIIDSLTKLLGTKPSNESAQKIHYYIGYAYFQVKSIDKSLENLNKALELAPDSEFAKTVKDAIEKLKKQK